MGYADFKYFEACDFAFRNSKGKVKQVPELVGNVPVADTHCHLAMLPDPGLAIAQAAHYGFGFLLSMTDPAARPTDDEPYTALEAYEAQDAWCARARELLAEWGEPQIPLPHIRYAVGAHPHNAKYFSEHEEDFLALLDNPLTSCVGEIGLDYHYDLSPRETQREVFVKQLQLADEYDLPVALHLREAHDEALEILREVGVPSAGCIVHCFNLDATALAPFVELGCHIAFGGPLTFKGSQPTRLACLDVPLNRLLTETDAPYMAPEPLRGTVCTPAQTVYTLRMLLDCFGYAGRDAAVAALTPRESDVAKGVAFPLQDVPDFAALQAGLDEQTFCERVYANAVDLLDQPRK